MFLPALTWAQDNLITVKGRVTSGGSPVPGATITVKGTSNGTTADATGAFHLKVPSDGALIITAINYAPAEFPVRGRTTLSVELEATEKSLGDVVVVGYGTQKKATLTGSISSVQGSEVVKSPQPNLSNSLAGRFSGLIANNTSGEPGYDGSGILIRGLATTGDNSVLIVVDGVPGQIGGLERLDPHDIESFSILKDASAAVYGSRAANGVILITTKRGKMGKPQINYNLNVGVASATRLPKMADAPMYATLMNEIEYYDNPAGGLNQFYTAAQIQKFRDGSDPIYYPNTDWRALTLRKSVPQTQQNLSLSGGTENIKYFLSAGLTTQDALYRNGATKYNQYNFRSNIDATVTPRLKFGLYLSGREESRQYPQVGASDIFRAIYRAYPTVLAQYPNGLLTTGIENDNPIAEVTSIGGTNVNPTYVFNGILKGSYSIPGVRGLSVDGFFAVDESFSFDKSFAKPYNLWTYDSTNKVYDATIVGGSNNLATLYESQQNTSLLTSNLKLNYTRQFGDHHVDAFVAYEQSTNHYDVFDANRLDFPTDLTPELSQGGSAATDATNGGSSYNFTRRSYIGRLDYNYKEKYLLEVQGRVDGSSTFPAGKQYGLFPAVSAGWRISKEKWFNVPVFDDLKFRASYGELGNDNVGLFQYFDNYGFNNQYVIGGSIHPGIDLTKLANPDITWERAKKTDIGLNAAFLHHFTLEFIYFQQKRSDILMAPSAAIAAVTGIVNPYSGSTLTPSENIGKINNNGVEATLGYTNHSGDFSYGISGNFTYAKSKVIYIGEAAGTLPYQAQTGHPLGTYLLYQATGIFRSAADLAKYPHLTGNQLGDLIYKDYNGDGQITADDQVRSKYGDIPLITYGFVLNGGYKNWDLSMVFAGQADVSTYVLPESGTVGNFYSSWADNRWSPNNPNGTYPRVDDRASSSINGGLYNNTFWLNNSAFLRMKNIQLGYTVNSKTLTKIKVTALRFYVSAFNLFTITKVKDYDPEGTSGSGQFYPQQKIINGGLNVSF
ncbi:SusC/RagA family TonB-linked outer membrane protein [Dinghuibacter silviterrae]|uniref:SusC/RagA family TonB-linked outer membrane protein n=1 Tax=Dinghuibacter silviterrae TaxID=1539049 RepID=UPI001FECB351|nr:TonB-dependent receptor [Dinghuibacter silviterrae]